jgi:O-antigen ligase
LTRRPPNPSSSLLTISVVLTLAWGALSFGGIYPWAYWPLLGACVVLGVAGLLAGGAERRPEIQKPLLMGLTLVMLAGSLQLVPLPRSMLIRLSPAADAVLQQHDLIYATDPNRPHALSIQPEASRLLLAFVIGFSIFFVGITAALPRLPWRTLARGLVLLGASLALLGIVQKATFTREIYGFWSSKYGGEPFGPFLNKNHFAGWMLMNLPVAIGYFHALTAANRDQRTWGWRRRLLWFSSNEAHEILLVGAAILVMAFALVMTLSRSGIGIFLFVLAMAGSLATRRHVARWERKLALASLSALAVVAVTWVGIDAVTARFVALPGSGLGGRVGIWRDTLQIVKDFPLTGSGLNTYGTAMLYYQTFGFPAYFPWAENDYLQLAAEGGLLVGIPFAVLAAVFVQQICRRLRENTDRVSWGIRVGAMTGLGAIALQELVDFSLQHPGHAALFSVLCALAVALPPRMSFPPPPLVR